MTASDYRLLADALLVAHAAYVAFVVGGQALILLGAWRGWEWTRNFPFRAAHLAAIGFVVWEAWAGVACPLTVWENRLRQLAGGGSYQAGFIEHWLQAIIFYRAPDWIFILVYTAFSLVVIVSFLLYPPRRRSRKK